MNQNPHTQAGTSKRHESDLALVREALRGTPEDVEKFLARMACVPAMVRSNYRSMRQTFPEEQLSDVIQETLTAIWSSLPEYEGRGSLESWAFGFCVRWLLKHMDGQHRQEKIKKRVSDRSNAHDQTVTADLPPDHERLYRALEDLDPRASRVIRMKTFEELTFQDIGDQMAMPPSSVKSLYYRGLKRLRALLEGGLGAPQ